jgi:hypothetical protein
MGEDGPAATPVKRPRARKKADGAAIVEAPAGPGATQALISRPTVFEDGASLGAERVELRMTGVGRVEASQVAVSQGAVGAIRADHVVVDRGMVGGALAERVEVSRGYARSVIARQVQLDRAAARVVIAAEVTTRQTAVVFLLARRVSGEMRVLFDWRGALAFGAAVGVVLTLLTRVRRKRR